MKLFITIFIAFLIAGCNSSFRTAAEVCWGDAVVCADNAPDAGYVNPAALKRIADVQKGLNALFGTSVAQPKSVTTPTSESEEVIIVTPPEKLTPDERTALEKELDALIDELEK